VNWNEDVEDVLDKDGGVDEVGEMEWLLGKTWGRLSTRSELGTGASQCTI
jgi:hypothetical protein